MYPFDPWIWRDPAALAGGYEHATPDASPAERGATAESRRGELDLSGYRVEATDGGVGAVEEAAASWLVVDTGPWIFGRRVLLPVGTVERVDHMDRVVHVDRTREQVKDSPEYDPDAPPDRDTVGRYWSGTYT